MAPSVHHPLVKSFFHGDTGTFTHVVHAGDGSAAGIIDPVLDYDPAQARVSTISADAVLAFVGERNLQVEWILETHAHADHLSAGGYLHERLGAPLAIGQGIVDVQARFKTLYDLGSDFHADGNQFDRLFVDGDMFQFGSICARVMATPGHTSDGLTYLIGDAAFVGDTVFAPDTGTARCDFPGGDAATLHRSLLRILALPAATRLFLCHDYPSGGRPPTPEWSIAAQVDGNVHIGGDAGEVDFVNMRNARDAGLPVPRLILPALQVNIRGGRLPAARTNGIRYLQLPLDQIGVKHGSVAAGATARP